MKKIREIIDKYAHDIPNSNNIILESDFDKLEKELEEYVCLENWKFLEYRDKCKERAKKAKELMKNRIVR